MSGNGVYTLDLPPAPACLVADSPHSGRDYPPDFDYACPLRELRKAEDAWLDVMYDFLPDLGVAFLKANFPRAYIDPNRADDVTAPFHADPGGAYTHHRWGLVREMCTSRSPHAVHDRPLSLREVFGRFSRCWQPYHEKLEEVVADMAARHGKAVHVDLHSMPSHISSLNDRNMYDIIIGTRDGATAAPALEDRLAALFREKGYLTGLNAPAFKGRELIARTGRPAEGRHGLQVEINRALYLDEETLDYLPRAAATKNDLREIMTSFRDFCAAFPAP